jgi:hypothetical protein
VGFPNQKPHCDQGQGHVVMPALPGAHLVLVHAHLAFASFEAGFNARARLDYPPQFSKRRFLKRIRSASENQNHAAA